MKQQKKLLSQASFKDKKVSPELQEILNMLVSLEAQPLSVLKG